VIFLNFLTKNLYLPGACALGEMRLFLNIDMIEAQAANVIRCLGGLSMLTSEQTAVFWGLSYLRKTPESAIMKELLRTRGLGSWVHPSVVGGRRGDRRGGKGGKLLDLFLDKVRKDAESEGITEEAVRERLSAVTGPKRDPFFLLIDSRSYGVKGGKLSTNFLDLVRKTAASQGITEETVRERISTVTGPTRDPFLLFQAAKSSGTTQTIITMEVKTDSYHSQVQAKVRLEDPSQQDFETSNSFFPNRDKHRTSKTHVLSQDIINVIRAKATDAMKKLCLSVRPESTRGRTNCITLISLNLSATCGGKIRRCTTAR
jgi:hypothetical protein